jgi:hypothetical protein
MSPSIWVLFIGGLTLGILFPPSWLLVFFLFYLAVSIEMASRAK